MNRLSKLIDGMDEEDLIRIRRDLVAGNIDKLIARKLEDKQGVLSEKSCPICHSEITSNAFVLEFGEQYLRRRAFFDGLDCLDYFIHTRLKKEEKQKEQ